MNKKIFYSIDSSMIFIFLLISFILAAPSGMSQFINGLPWNMVEETILITCLIPIFLILYRKVLLKKSLIFILLIIFCLKLILLLSPQIGIKHQQFNKDSQDRLSYYSFWDKEIATLQLKNWGYKKNFPLDWVNFDEEINIKLGETAENSPDYLNLSVINNLIFSYLADYNDDYIVIKGDGIIDISTPIKNFEILKSSNNKYIIKKIKKGINKISLNIKFKGEKWSLSFYNSDDKSLFEKKKVFTKLDDNQIKFINFFKFISYIYDFLCYFFIIIVFFLLILSMRSVKNYFFLTLPVIFSIFILLSDLVINYFLINYNFIFNFNTFKLINVFGLPIVLSSFLISVFAYNHLYNKNNLKFIFDSSYKDFFYLICLPILFYWVKIHFNTLENTYFWTGGDDWHVFQKFSRSIVLNYEWLRAGEDVFYFRPGIRYVFAILHILFGDSAFAQIMLDAWSAIGISLIVYLFFKKTNINNQLIFYLVSILLILFFGEKYRLLLGRGLSEFFGCLTLMLAAYLLFISNLKNIYLYVFIILLGIITAWIREEKILVVLSLVFLLLKNDKGTENNNLLINSINFIKNNFFQIFKYCLFIIIGFPLLFELRNYLVGSGFTISSHPSVLKLNYLAIYNMMFAVEWPEIPRFTSILLTSSIIVSLLSVFSKNINKLIDIPGIQIIILAIFVPTIALEMPGYSPRHTIYLLPFSVLLFGSIYDKIFIRNNTK